MSAPYKSELCHALDPSRITFHPTTVSASDPLANEHQLKKNDLLDDIAISSRPMSAPYKSELCHALDPSRITFHPTTDSASNPLANEHQLKENDLLDEDELCDEVCDVTHSCKKLVLCQWTDKDPSKTCGAKVSCKMVPVHFRDTHNIRDMDWKTKVYCWWKGCDKWVSRKNFARHTREAHLDHPRLKKDSC